MVCKHISIIKGGNNSCAERHDQEEEEHHRVIYLSEGNLMGLHLNKSLRSSTGSQE